MPFFRDIKNYWPKGKPLPADGIFVFYDTASDCEYKVLPEQLAPPPVETDPLTEIDSEHITDASEAGRELLTSADAPSQLALLDSFSYPATADHAAFTRIFGDQGAMKYALDKLVALGASTVPGAFPVVTGFLPGKGAEGISVTITGSRFTDASQVSFNGTPASFQVLNATTIQAVVPVGATTGPVAVTTPAGTGTSAASFTVGATVTPGDTLAPNITLTVPAAGATLTAGQQVLLTATATDNVAVTQVVFTNGATGALLGMGAKNGNSYTLPYTPQAVGALTITATASDAAGNSQAASGTVNVQAASSQGTVTPGTAQGSDSVTFTSAQAA